MDDLWMRIADGIADRVGGPMKLRLLMQPMMATLLAIRSGLRDAKTGTPPYLWSLLSNPGHRGEMLKSGWQSVAKLFCVALVLDLVYQYIEQPVIRLRAAIFIAVILAIVPYLLLRGLVTRLATWWKARQKSSEIVHSRRQSGT
jgi:hypothetical protein